MQEGLELEKMQVPPGPLYAIMDRLISPATGRTPQTFGIASAVEVALSLIGCKANPSNLPGFLETESGSKMRSYSQIWCTAGLNQAAICCSSSASLGV
jgi:hypothetical protein